MTLPRTPSPSPGSPFLIAHRAGNDLARLRDAEALGARLIEADLRLFNGRVDVRHLKSLGPVPIFWDCWFLAKPFVRHLQLAQLLDACGPQTHLMLDLKGRNLRLARKLRDELLARPEITHVTICARSWRLLEPFADMPGVRTVCSVGSERGLKRLLARASSGTRIGGVSIHRKLLCADTVRELSAATELVMSWPVNDPHTAQLLGDWGVHGLITDVPEELVDVVQPEREMATA